MRHKALKNLRCALVFSTPNNASKWDFFHIIKNQLIILYSIHFRFLELESSGRRDELRLHYTHDQQTHVETFPYRIADNRWYQIALTLSANHVTLYINCSKIYERVILTLDRYYVAGKYLSLYIGQRNRQTAHFRVSNSYYYIPSSEILEFPGVNLISSLVTISTLTFTSCRNLGTTFFIKHL